MTVREVEPARDTAGLLDGAQFADASCVTPSRRPANARAAAERMFSGSPPWVDRLMALRNLMVRPFGLKPGRPPTSGADSVGMFPVVSQSADRLVAGFDDKHLDFRVVVDLSGEGAVTVATLVRINNLLGRAYLTVIMPFHRLIVRSMLARLA